MEISFSLEVKHYGEIERVFYKASHIGFVSKSVLYTYLYTLKGNVESSFTMDAKLFPLSNIICGTRELKMTV